MEQPVPSSGPTYYNEEFIFGVDEKRRLQVPAKWRPTDPATELTLVVWRESQHGPCVRALPPNKMAELVEHIKKLPQEKRASARRSIGRESAQVSIDKSGRIGIPEAMKATAGIGNKAVLIGLVDSFEIWSPERYEKVVAADKAVVTDLFGDLD